MKTTKALVESNSKIYSYLKNQRKDNSNYSSFSNAVTVQDDSPMQPWKEKFESSKRHNPKKGN